MQTVANQVRVKIREKSTKNCEKEPNRNEEISKEVGKFVDGKQKTYTASKKRTYNAHERAW